jgi:hypothetical protein
MRALAWTVATPGDVAAANRSISTGATWRSGRGLGGEHAPDHLGLRRARGLEPAAGDRGGALVAVHREHPDDRVEHVLVPEDLERLPDQLDHGAADARIAGRAAQRRETLAERRRPAVAIAARQLLQHAACGPATRHLVGNGREPHRVEHLVGPRGRRRPACERGLAKPVDRIGDRR